LKKKKHRADNNSATVLVGRVARKKKRKLGVDLAVRAETINEEAINKNDKIDVQLTPIVLWIDNSNLTTLVQHGVMTQVGALIRVEYHHEAPTTSRVHDDNNADAGKDKEQSAHGSRHPCSRRVATNLQLLECPGEPRAVQAVLKVPSLWYSLRVYQSIGTEEDDQDEELDFHAKNQHFLVRQIVARLQRRPPNWANHRKERPPQVTNQTLQALQALEDDTALVAFLSDTTKATSPTYTKHDNLLCLPTNDQGDFVWNLPQHEDEDFDMPSNHHKLTRREYLRTKKFPQIHWLLRRLQQLRRESLAFGHVLDVGGGRGDLAFQVASLFNDSDIECDWDRQGARYDGVHVTVIDNNKSSLRAGEAFVQQQQHPGVASRMHWRCQDFGDYIQELHKPNDNKASKQSSSPDNCDSSSTTKTVPPVDLVIAWHACGDLTDRAIDMALKLGAALVACPCCYAKMTQQPTHQKVASKMAELQQRPDLSRRGMHIINSQRLARFVNHQEEEGGINLNYEVSLEEYSLQWSGRNQVLVAIPLQRKVRLDRQVP